MKASQAWESFYQQVTGHRADLAWANITTPAHPESYRDMAWLAEDKSAVQRIWGQQDEMAMLLESVTRLGHR